MTQRAYVVGDLHLGAGPNDPLEDFDADDLFVTFCEKIAGPDTTLLLNGDIVDFAQIAPFEVPKRAHLLWTEAASLTKLETALAAHADFFDKGLARLLASGAQVKFLIGNHDLDMVWQRVQARLRQALGHDGDRLAFVRGGVDYHGVHVEHGHAFTPENCPRDVLDFLHLDADGVPRLERVWGTDFMLQFYNDLERRYPFADCVKPMLKVVWHGLRKRWIGARTIARMLVFLKRRGLPWAAIADGALAGPDEVDGAEIAAAFDDERWHEAVIERFADDGFVDDFKAALAELDRSEAQIVTAADHVDADTLATEPAAAAATAATLGLFRDGREVRAARAHFAAGATHVVFGHTHEVVDGAENGRLFNYGTWIPSLDLKRPEVKERIDREGLTLEILGDKSLYATEQRVVRIEATPSLATVELRTPDRP